MELSDIAGKENETEGEGEGTERDKSTSIKEEK